MAQILRNSISEEPTSPWTSLIILVRLGKACFISTLDLTKGYWQVMLTTEARPKTVFSTALGHGQYQVPSFDLHGAPVTFQRLMNIVFWPHRLFGNVRSMELLCGGSTGPLSQYPPQLQTYHAWSSSPEAIPSRD